MKPVLQAEYQSKEPTAKHLRQARCEVYSFVLDPLPVLAGGVCKCRWLRATSQTWSENGESEERGS